MTILEAAQLEQRILANLPVYIKELQDGVSGMSPDIFAASLRYCGYSAPTALYALEYVNADGSIRITTRDKRKIQTLLNCVARLKAHKLG